MKGREGGRREEGGLSMSYKQAGRLLFIRITLVTFIYSRFQDYIFSLRNALLESSVWGKFIVLRCTYRTVHINMVLFLIIS